MQGAILLDNSATAEIHGGGTVELDCLVEVGSYNVSSSDLSIKDCTVRKEIIFMLGVTIECSINCISLFNIIFLHCWAHI